MYIHKFSTHCMNVPLQSVIRSTNEYTAVVLNKICSMAYLCCLLLRVRFMMIIIAIITKMANVDIMTDSTITITVFLFESSEPPTSSVVVES